MALAILGLLAAPAAACAQEAPAARAARLADTVARGWASVQDSRGQFPNPSAVEAGEGTGAFAPPMLIHGLSGAAARSGDATLERAAGRAWPSAVAPVRASAFDMLGAAMTYRRLWAGAELEPVVSDYLRAYAVSPLGRACVRKPSCYHNLKLVDAAAVLVMTGSGLRSQYPGTRLEAPELARAQAAQVVDLLVPAVTDHRLRARIRGRALRASTLSDPGRGDPLAYHALSAYMLAEAVAELGPQASRPARRALRETLDALSVLVSPDGDVSYMGRGQEQVWVPALAAAAAAHGVRLHAATDPVRAARLAAVADRALARLERLHLRPDGRLRLVPGERTTHAGIDWYANTVAYNGLALHGLDRAAELLASAPVAPSEVPADRGLLVADPLSTRLGISQRARTWMAVRGASMREGDLRYDFGLLSAKVRRADGTWSDLLGPRPLTKDAGVNAAPVLIRGAAATTAQGRGVRVRRDGTVEARLLQRAATGRVVRRLWQHARPVRGGVRLALFGARRGDTYRMLFFVPPGAGTWDARTVSTGAATITFPSAIAVTRVPGWHSAAAEHLDALQIVVRAGRRGALRWQLAATP